MSLEYRSNDAMVTICQNNRQKTITISSINKAAQELMGYSADELMDKPLSSILPNRISELLMEYVEFEDSANDVGIVLSRVQSFSVIGKDGKEKAYRLKLSQTQSGGGELFFSLILRDTLGVRKNEATRGAIQHNFKGHETIDEKLGLPDRASLEKDFELIKYYITKGNIDSCFGVMRIDSFEALVAEHGEAVVDGMVRHLILTARQNLRPDDILGSVGGGEIGVLLVDAQSSSARMVFNRLRWQIAANPYIYTEKSTIGSSVSVAFCNIDAMTDEKSVIPQCEKALERLASDEINRLIEVNI